MERYWRLFYPVLFALFQWEPPAFSASAKTVIADGQFVMADDGTVAGAEAKVLQ